ncbi:MAG: DUF1553 domain-containing protein [Mariniblastus sp.]|nr:DUF1553 domain-containing protein [Mariniblastus sp.]
MRYKSWGKNILFLLLIAGSLSALTLFLMASDRIENPASFRPNSDQHADVVRAALKVDAAFEGQWSESELSSAERSLNLTIARRLSLGLAGTIPSVEEIRRFEEQGTDEQIHWWVSRLVEDQRTSNHLAERFARALVGVEDGPFLIYRRRRFVSWFSDQIAANLPYDVLVRNILTDEGLWTDTPSVNFYTRTILEDGEKSRPDPILLAGRTSRAFLGMRIDCLQCHDDFLGTINLGSAEDLAGGTQRDFHSLAAFFVEMENSLLGIRDQTSQGPYQYQLLDDDKTEVIEPEVPFNRNLAGDEHNLRMRLANWVTHPENRPFARAAVNRVWAIMAGRGLLQPVDDIPLEGPFPLAMEVLVDDFIEHGFDLHRLIRVIALSEAYQLESVADFEVTSLHESNWSVFPALRLRPGQVAGAIAQSTKLATIDSTSHIITQLTKFGQQNDFVQRFGDPGEDEFKDRGETVTQRLLMLNGSMIDERLKNLLHTPVFVARLSPDVERAIETIYLATLTRRPSAQEKRRFVSQISSFSGDERVEAVLDLYWALINSAEFRWNH